MAFTIDELNALTNTYVLGQPTDVYFTTNALLMKLMNSKRSADGGKYVDCPLEHGAAHTGVYGNTTVIPTTKTETHNKAYFPWGGYFAAQTVDLTDRVQNNGEAAIVNLVAAKFANMNKSIKKKMGAGIYLNDVVGGVQGFAGLAALFSTVTSTAYGGIKQDDVSLWAANNSSTATVGNFKGFQAIRLPAIVDTTNEGMPDLYMTTQAIKDGFEASLQAQVRYSDATLALKGFSNVMFDGAPVVADLNQTASYVDALNTRMLEFVSHKDFDFTTPKWEADRTQPDIWTASIRWVGQICCKHRKAHSRFTAVSAPA
ncbi:MAG TPA: phage major capsid protein [Geobacter sp.]|nr:phage major capsid protein [Geobacter sp.]